MIFFRLDECISYRIADAAKTIGIPQGVVFETPHSRKEKGMKDVPWIASFAKRGKLTDRRVVFSSDGRMRLNEVERAAAESAGLIVFYAPKFDFWRHLHSRGQAAYILRWLDRMAAVAASASDGAQYQLPSTFNTAVKIRELPSVIAVRPKRPRRAKSPKPAGPLFPEAAPQ